MTGGYVLIHRSVFDHHAFDNPPFTEREAWIWLIMQASYEPHTIRYYKRLITVGRGEVPCSYRKLAEKWKWGVNRVSSFLAILEADGMISKKMDTGFLIVTVCNYEKYQRPLTKSDTSADTAVDTPPDTGADTASDTNINKGNNINKINKGKEEGCEVSPPAPPSPPPAEKNSIDYQKLVAIWNETLNGLCPRIVELTAARRNSFRLRFSDSFSSDYNLWRAYCNQIRGQPFCHGQNNRGWRASIDWALRPSSIASVREGAYENKILESPPEIDDQMERFLKRAQSTAH